jgi:nucleoside-diphosphate-sugar epimerase
MLRYPAQAFVDTNFTGTLNLLEAAVAASHDRFIFTSTTSLMIPKDIHEQTASSAVWLDENIGPLAPRNIYGVTKLAAEGLCRLHFIEHGLNCVVLRTGRFFPEEDDTLRELSGPNLKANEFLNRRLTVEDAADAHVAALDRAPALGFEIFVVSAPTPFVRSEAAALKHGAARVIEDHFPDVSSLYAQRGWRLPTSLDRIYDAGRIERVLGFRCKVDFARILGALRTGDGLPFIHDPTYQSPKNGSASQEKSHESSFAKAAPSGSSSNNQRTRPGPHCIDRDRWVRASH